MHGNNVTFITAQNDEEHDSNQSALGLNSDVQDDINVFNS